MFGQAFVQQSQWDKHLGMMIVEDAQNGTDHIPADFGSHIRVQRMSDDIHLVVTGLSAHGKDVIEILIDRMKQMRMAPAMWDYLVQKMGDCPADVVCHVQCTQLPCQLGELFGDLLVTATDEHGTEILDKMYDTMRGVS